MLVRKIKKRWPMMLLASISMSILVVMSPLPALITQVEYQRGYGGEVTEIKVFLDDLFFQLEGKQENAPIILKAGQRVEIEFENIGFLAHQIVFGKEALFEKGEPLGYKENLLQDVKVEIRGQVNGKVFKIDAEDLISLELDPEAKLKVEFTVPRDKVEEWEWELGCFVPGHYEAGMHAPLLVKE